MTPREQQRPYASHGETDRSPAEEHHDATQLLVVASLRKYVGSLVDALLEDAKITELFAAEEIMEKAYFSSSSGELRLMGFAEVRLFLGLKTRARLGQLRETKGLKFPEPVAELACGPIWLAHDIEQFKKTWRRLPGRPPKEPRE